MKKQDINKCVEEIRRLYTEAEKAEGEEKRLLQAKITVILATIKFLLRPYK